MKMLIMLPILLLTIKKVLKFMKKRWKFNVFLEIVSLNNIVDKAQNDIKSF